MTSVGPRRHHRYVAIVLCLVLFAVSSPAHGGGATPCEPSSTVDDQRASRILAERRPFAPTDRNVFYTFDHPDWTGVSPPENPAGPGLSDTETGAALRAFLERRFPCAPDRVRDALAVYGDPVARQKVPDPTLRAALAALTGTVGEPAISFLLYRTPVTLISFGIFVQQEVGFPERVAGVGRQPDGTQFIVIDRRYRFAPFGAISALLLHEALHAGADEDHAALPEESIAMAFEGLVYMEMLLTDPSLASLPDELTRWNNNRIALVRLNSGIPGSTRLNLFVPASEVSVDPLAYTAPSTDFYGFVTASYEAPEDPGFGERVTEGNWLLEQMLGGLAEPGAKLPDQPDFDSETLEFVDRNQNALSPAELVTVACILRLDVPCR